MKKTITPDEYHALPEKERYSYQPVYTKWKTKKERLYESCELGYIHYLGWTTKHIPVGKPIRYECHKSLTGDLQAYYADEFLQQSLAPIVGKHK